MRTLLLISLPGCKLASKIHRHLTRAGVGSRPGRGSAPTFIPSGLPSAAARLVGALAHGDRIETGGGPKSGAVAPVQGMGDGVVSQFPSGELHLADGKPERADDLWPGAIGVIRERGQSLSLTQFFGWSRDGACQDSHESSIQEQVAPVWREKARQDSDLFCHVKSGQRTVAPRGEQGWNCSFER